MLVMYVLDGMTPADAVVSCWREWKERYVVLSEGIHSTIIGRDMESKESCYRGNNHFKLWRGEAVRVTSCDILAT